MDAGSVAAVAFAPAGPVEPHGIIYEQFAPQLGTGSDAGDHVDKVAIIVDVGFQVGVRPIGSPQAAVGIVGDQGRNRVGKSMPRVAANFANLRVKPIGAGGFEQDILACVE